MKRLFRHMRTPAVLFLCLLLALLLPAFSAFTVSASEASSGTAVSADSVKLTEPDNSNMTLDENGQPVKPGSDVTTGDNAPARGSGFMGFGNLDVRESANLPTYLIICYLIGIVIPIIGIIALLRAYATRESAMLIVADVICLFYNAVYFQHLNASGIGESVMTLKMSMLCSMLFILFFTMFMASYMSFSRMRGPITLYGFLTVLTVAILWDNRYSALVYDNMTFSAASAPL